MDFRFIPGGSGREICKDTRARIIEPQLPSSASVSGISADLLQVHRDRRGIPLRSAGESRFPAIARFSIASAIPLTEFHVTERYRNINSPGNEINRRTSYTSSRQKSPFAAPNSLIRRALLLTHENASKILPNALDAPKEIVCQSGSLSRLFSRSEYRSRACRE